MSQANPVHVAVGVVINANSEVLVSLRAAGSHQGGLWEFPGGKVEPGESVQNALNREFQEELGITVHGSSPFIRIEHHYSDKSVLLDVWKVSRFSGIPSGREGQTIDWRSVSSLQASEFPLANERIIRALTLPDKIAITPEAADFSELRKIISHLIDLDIDLIYFRQKSRSTQTYLEWFKWANALCQANGIRLMFSQELEGLESGLVQKIDAYHVSSERLLSLKSRPLSKQRLFSASCHDLQQLKLAESLDADFVLLSPVGATGKYSSEQLLGWDGFENLVGQINTPVYALGGVDLADIDICRARRGFGIAGISAFMPSPV